MQAASKFYACGRLCGEKPNVAIHTVARRARHSFVNAIMRFRLNEVRVIVEAACVPIIWQTYLLSHARKIPLNVDNAA
jgi:hypothetical protein